MGSVWQRGHPVAWAWTRASHTTGCMGMHNYGTPVIYLVILYDAGPILPLMAFSRATSGAFYAQLLAQFSPRPA